MTYIVHRQVRTKLEYVQKRIDVLAGHDKKVDLDKHKVRIKDANGRGEMVSARQFITDPKYKEFGSGLDRLDLLKNGQTMFDKIISEEVKTPFVITAKRAMGVEYQRSVDSLHRSLTARKVRELKGKSFSEISERAKRLTAIRPEDLPKK